jgi:hypothetical protein
MRNLEILSAKSDPGSFLADLYWVAYLLTGNRDLSVQAAEQSLEFDDVGNPFFDSWIVGWSRKLFIARILESVKPELHASMLRLRSVRLQNPGRSPGNASISRFTGKAKLEEALLQIDIFPRCAVVLRVFEQLPLEDAAVLLDADQAVVAAAHASGLLELVGNLTAERGCCHRSAYAPVGCRLNAGTA